MRAREALRVDGASEFRPQPRACCPAGPEKRGEPYRAAVDPNPVRPRFLRCIASARDSIAYDPGTSGATSTRELAEEAVGETCSQRLNFKDTRT